MKMFMTNRFFISFALFIGFLTLSAQNIPLDPTVTTGKLANGLTYYIKQNNKSENSAQLYLVNKAGSVLEDDDQQGLAHFMEHMNFNGTKNFPKNKLVDYLQKAGITFGADLNAYTSFDETVYMLPIPTNDSKMLGKGLDVLRDWACETTLASDEIDKERGVVLEEARLRKGRDDRMSRQYFSSMLNYSRYADRLPIGKDSILKSFTSETIRRFKNDWYRPNLQAIIVVGNINVKETEKLIREKFSNLKNPKNERARPIYQITLKGANQYSAVTDDEQPNTSLQIMFKHNDSPLITEADYINSIKKSLFNQMLGERRTEILNQEPNPTYTSVGASIQPLLDGVDMFSFTVVAKKDKLKESLFQTWNLIEKIKRFGFTQKDLTIAKENYLRRMESQWNEKENAPSAAYVKEYQNLFLKSEAAPGIDWEYNFVKSKIPAISLEDINGITTEYLQDKNRDILILAPSTEKDGLPSEVTILDWMEKIHNEDMTPFKDVEVNKPLMSILPVPGTVIATRNYPELNITELTLSNGVKVILKPTDFKNDEINFSAYSPGGTSLYDDKDFYNAFNTGAMISQFGLGDFNPTELSKKMNGKIVGISSNITERSEVINGNAAPKDLETALQLVYLKFVNPRKDAVLFKNIINKSKENIANRYTDPVNVFSDTISSVMGNYNYRSEPPSLKKLDELNLDKIYNIYKERFDDASGFTFVFVGNFDVTQITPLLVQYLGSLSSLYKKEEARNLSIHIPSGKLIKKVYKGIENKAIIRLVASGDYEFSAINNLYFKALGEILEMRLLKELREVEGEVYSPSIQTIYNKDPKNRYALLINFGCAPKNADYLVSLVELEMKKIMDTGVTKDEIEKFKAAYTKNIDLAIKDNGFWLNYLISQYQNNEDIYEVNSAKLNIDKVNESTLKASAQIFLSSKNFITFELLPANM
jgi:zinc protease